MNIHLSCCLLTHKDKRLRDKSLTLDNTLIILTDLKDYGIIIGVDNFVHTKYNTKQKYKCIKISSNYTQMFKVLNYYTPLPQGAEYKNTKT